MGLALVAQAFVDVAIAGPPRDEHLDLLAHHLIAGIAQELLGGAVDAGDMAVVSHQQHRVGSALPDRLRQGISQVAARVGHAPPYVDGDTSGNSSRACAR